MWTRYSARQPKSEPSTDKTTRLDRYKVILVLIAPFWFGGIALYLILPTWIMFLSIPLPDSFRLIMVSVAVLSIPFHLWALRTLGKNWVHALDRSGFMRRKEATLVTNGPYRYVRNPIYLWSFVFLIALSLEAANWLLFVPTLFMVALLYAQVGKEERMLIDKFGDEYREYMKRTPQFIPKFRHVTRYSARNETSGHSS
jgi:protein-S-isoprenylcysteine O-methyltransferase Ste14